MRIQTLALNTYLLLISTTLVSSFSPQNSPYLFQQQKNKVNREREQAQANVEVEQPVSLWPSTHTQEEEISYTIKKEFHILSPPQVLNSLDLHETIAPLEILPDLTITRVSYDPNIFLFRNFLSSSTEQVSMIMAAVNQGMEYSGTSSGDVVSQRVKSYTSWIYPDEEDGGEEEDTVAEDDIYRSGGTEIARHMTELSEFLFLPEDLRWLDRNSTFGCSAEPVQIVRYEEGGKYDLHHDGYNRFMTILTYLNGVAGTWFPHAIVDKREYEKIRDIDRKEEIPDMTMDDYAKDKVKGEDGLLVIGSEYERNEEDGTCATTLEMNNNVVKVNPGDAIAFYSYDWIESFEANEIIAQSIDQDGPPPTGPIMNFRALHTGLTTEKSEKWIATNWFRLEDELENIGRTASISEI